MALEDRDRDMELDEQASYYDEDPAYAEDTYFGERLDEGTETDDEALEDDTLTNDDVAAAPANRGFGETIGTMPDPDTAAEDTAAEREAPKTDTTKSDVDHESLLDKAKDKFDEWTGRDHEA